MPRLQFSLEGYDQYILNSFDGGMKSNPLKPNESFILYNMILREDGKLCPRGTIYEYQLPSASRPSTTFPLDTIVNNSGGLLYNSQSTPYFFFLESSPSSGNLEFWAVNLNSSGNYQMTAIDHVTSTTTQNPSVPSYTYAIDNNGKPFFLFANWSGAGDDKLYQFNGSIVTTVSSSPPASQIMLGYYDRSTFAGGGSVNGSLSMRSMVYWSQPLSITTWPSTQFTVPFADRGMVLQDMAVLSGRPVILSNTSFLSLTGDASAYLPVEIGRVEDILLKGTLGTAGTELYVAGLNGVYNITTSFKDISLPIKGLYTPKTNSYGVSTAISYVGYGTLSSNSYFYGIRTKAIPNTWFKLTPTTNEQDNMLVYDARFKIWYYWGLPFTVRGMASISPKPATVTTQATNFLSGFAFSGFSPSNNNALYELEVTNTTGSDQVDGNTVNYTTGFVSAPMDFGVPYGLKHIGGIHVIGVTQNAVTLTIESIDESNNTVTQVFTGTLSSLPGFLPWSQPMPLRKARVSLQGDSTTILDSIVVYWRLEKSTTTISTFTPSLQISNTGDTVQPGTPPAPPVTITGVIHRELTYTPQEWQFVRRSGGTFAPPTTLHRIHALMGMENKASLGGTNDGWV